MTGAQGAGKTTFLKKVIAKLAHGKVRMDGFIADGIWKADKRHGFNLISIRDGISLPLCTRESIEDYVKLGHFYFNPVALQLGDEIITRDKKQVDIMIIDEIGIFEIEEKVWFRAFDHLLKATSTPVLMSVREKILQQVVEKFRLKCTKVIQVTDHVDETVETILSGLENN